MGPNMAPTWAQEGPKKQPKSASEIGRGSPFFGFDVGKPWETDLGAIWVPSWGRLGPILGHLGRLWGELGAVLDHFLALWGLSWAHLGVNLGILRPLLAIWR